MSHWLMKIGPDEYVEWSTIVDAVVAGPFSRDGALAHSAEALGSPEAALERLLHTDEHLCSCTARLGESFEIRNGRAVAVGGGRLAFSFATYAEVREYMGRAA
jgi:hypothetical protein